MTFDPTQNRIQTCLLTADEWAALKAAIKANGSEFINSATEWFWCETLDPPTWHETTVYRAKPAPRPTIICNGVEVPEPVRDELEAHTKYWVANPAETNFAENFAWANDDMDLLWLSRGLIHLTKAAAVSHAKAMAKAGCV